MEAIRLWDVIQTLGLLVMGVLAWIAKNQVARIERLEESRASNDAVRDLKQDMKDHRTETRDSFSRLFDRIDDIADRLPKP